MPADFETDEDLEQRASVIRARQLRLDALAKKAFRRRATRSRIILGGSILADIRDNPDDTAFINRIVAILDERVFLARDRDDLRTILGIPVADELPVSNSSTSAAPDFETLEVLALRVPRSLTESDSDFADIRDLIPPASRETDHSR